MPYYHSNVDSDEIMFYVDGDYEARKGSGIGKGSISVHPGSRARAAAGASEASGVDYFDETAVMVDTFRPSSSGRAAAVDDGKYAWSWSAGQRGGGTSDGSDYSIGARGPSGAPTGPRLVHPRAARRGPGR